MKKIILTTFITVVSNISFAQTTILGQNRQLNFGPFLKRANPAIDLDQSINPKQGSQLTNVQLKNGMKFTIIGETETDYLINIWRYKTTKGSPKSNIYKNAVYVEDSSIHQYYVYLLPKNQLDILSKRLYKRYSATYGITTFPFKYRPQTGVFEPTFSLSATGGVKRNFNRTSDDYSVSLLLGVGPSSISLTPDNTAPWSGITSTVQSSAVTLSLALMFQFERVQIGMTYGIDNKMDGNREEWLYQGKDWLSLGVGIGLFTNSLQTNVGNQ